MKRGLSALIAFLVLAAPADASLGRWGLTPAGDPYLTVSRAHMNIHPPGNPFFRVCPPGEACRDLGDGSRPIEPGLTAAGTVFESDLTDENGTTTERSPAWQGRVAALSAPSLTGDPVVGGTVKPVAARWSGGWGDEFTTVGVIACPLRTGGDCEYLTHPNGQANFGVHERAVREKHVGWFLFAVEYRSARDRDPFIVDSPIPPGARTSLPAVNALAAVGTPVGPVVSPEVTPVITPAAKPTVSVRSPVRRVGRRVVFGSVTCPVRCSVMLRVGDGRRTITRQLRVRGTAQLAILRGRLLRPGRLHIRVDVDGKTFVLGRVRLRR